MERKKILNGFYETANEKGRLESRAGIVEYATTMHFIQRYAKKGDHLAEIGAGTGRYSCTLARMGFRVDAVELVEKHIELFRGQITPEMDVTIRQGDATDLSALPTEKYDITLLLGPMYHLFRREDKLKALAEAVRITKKGGVIFAAYCMADASIIQHGFLKGNIQTLLDKGMLDSVTFETHSEPQDIFELYRKKQIDELREGFPVRQLHYAASDGYAHHMRSTLAQTDEQTFEYYLQYHLATCELPELTGYSNHTLDIFQKLK